MTARRKERWSELYSSIFVPCSNVQTLEYRCRLRENVHTRSINAMPNQSANQAKGYPLIHYIATLNRCFLPFSLPERKQARGEESCVLTCVVTVVKSSGRSCLATSSNRQRSVGRTGKGASVSGRSREDCTPAVSLCGSSWVLAERAGCVAIAQGGHRRVYSPRVVQVNCGLGQRRRDERHFR